jgi:hypothetical protein
MDQRAFPQLLLSAICKLNSFNVGLTVHTFSFVIRVLHKYKF